MKPDSTGHFGPFGGKFVPETLMRCLAELESSYKKARQDPAFKHELARYLKTYVGRPTALYFAKQLSASLKPLKIYLKREDLCHTGAHKLNNSIAQALLAKRMGKKRVIAETGAGQHGVATATAAALFGLECEVFMGTEDIRRQRLNVFRMRLLGTTVTPVESGSCTLKDATNEALRNWVTTVESTHYIIGSVVGPHPFPMMVRDFQSVIGREAKRQITKEIGKLPDYLVACVGGGSNSIGLFYPFYTTNARFIGVEAAGYGVTTDKHAATLSKGTVGVLHGSASYLLQDRNGQIKEVHSISAGLDYPGVGPEHAYLKKIARCDYVAVTDKEALDGVKMLSEYEGIIPALESAHAIAYLKKLARKVKRNTVVVVCLSGRGDKDVETIAEYI